MNRLFGKAKEKTPDPTIAETIANTEARGDSVDKKIRKLDGEIRGYGEQMRKMRPGRARDMVKQKAMRCLQQKKTYEGHLMNMQSQAFNMEQQAFAIQSVKDTQVTVQTMEAGVKELRKGMKKINIDKVEDLQDTMEDLLEDTNEMQEVLGRAYGCPDELNDEDLEAELDALGDMDFDMESDLLPDMPDAATASFNDPAAVAAPAQPAGQVPVDEFGLAELN